MGEENEKFMCGGDFELQLSGRGGCSMKPNRYQGLMIRPALIFFSAATIVFLSACQSDQDDRPRQHHVFGYGSDNQTEVAPTTDAGATTPTNPDTTPDTGPIAPPPPPPPNADNGAQSGAPNTSGTNGAGVVKKDYPYGQPVAGKPGFVTSPYAPYNGYVDVRGFPPGTEVKDPYTQKVFLVP